MQPPLGEKWTATEGGVPKRRWSTRRKWRSVSAPVKPVAISSQSSIAHPPARDLHGGKRIARPGKRARPIGRSESANVLLLPIPQRGNGEKRTLTSIIR